MAVQLLFLPLFGLSRIRFHWNVALGCFVLCVYFAVAGAASSSSK